jgi:hypothetical protein
MSRIETASVSLRSARLRARAPRLLAYSLAVILCLAGLQAIIAGPPEASVVRASNPLARATDRAAEAFAEGFTRAYLTWDSAQPEERERLLAPYLPSSMDADAGLSPPLGTKQEVLGTAVVGTRPSQQALNVTVVAHTTDGPTHLSIPVARNPDGFLYVAGNPAVVGGPPVQRDISPPVTEEVDDGGLRTVVTRAITNYLTGARQNLFADLTPNAVVSLPARAMNRVDVGDITWLEAPHRVAVEVTAQDSLHGAWSLRYELEVRRRDRWYVQAIQDNPTHKGDS